MPPKSSSGPNKKTVEKQKAKVVEDKTFGLKNKKGAKQQKFIEQVVKQVANKGQQNRREVDPALERERKKEEEKKRKEELAELFKPVISQTCAKGVDPKSVLCLFFKQGTCQKGDKCKFSHDLTKERKSEKRSVYEDVRQDDTMDKWDKDKLEDVINKKHGEENKDNTTSIVCKYFIEAVENSTYGWFWTCPNDKEGGTSCIYRHALPPGFQLKSAKGKEEKEEIALETLIETERAALGSNVTKVTLESFLAWKIRKVQEKKDKVKEQEDKKKRDFKLGFMNGLTGRDIFTFNPDLIANDDDEATADVDYRHRVEDDEEVEVGEDGVAVTKASVKEINLEALTQLATDVDGTGTIATSDRFDYIKTLVPPPKEEKKLDMACGGGGELEDIEDDDEGEEEEEEGDEDKENNAKTAPAATANNKNIEIDESLFTLEDLSNIQDELENLDI